MRQIDVCLKVGRLLSGVYAEGGKRHSEAVERRAGRDGSAPRVRSRRLGASDSSRRPPTRSQRDRRQYVASCWMKPAARQPAAGRFSPRKNAPALYASRKWESTGRPRSSHLVGNSVVSHSTSGNVAKTSPITESDHGIKRSSEPSHPITSPDVWANPLLMASHAPPSGSETHHARSCRLCLDHVRTTVGRPSVHDDVLEFRVSLAKHRIHGRRQVLRCG